jgi:hypothetical protein
LIFGGIRLTEEKNSERGSMEYTEMISIVPDIEKHQEVLLGKISNSREDLAGIIDSRDRQHNVSVKPSLEEALIECFTGGQSPWFCERMTFNNRDCLGRILLLVDRYGSLSVFATNDGLGLKLATVETPIIGNKETKNKEKQLIELTELAVQRMFN